MDVCTGGDRILCRLERIVGGKHETVGVGDQGIAGDAGFLLVSPGKTAVDHEQFAAAFNRRLSVFFLDRNMAVDDMGVFPAC